MSSDLEEALAYAKRDSVWLERPAQQHRYLQALAAEVLRLRAENASAMDAKTVFKKFVLTRIDHIARRLSLAPK